MSKARKPVSLKPYLWGLLLLVLLAFLLLSPPVQRAMRHEGLFNLAKSTVKSLFRKSAAARVAPNEYKVHGIDVSFYQGRIDWARVKLGKPSFAFIRATQGKSLVDKRFARNWKGARKAGLIRGAYHFFTPSLDAEAQAANFIKQVKLLPGDLPPVLDVERTEGKTAEEIREGMQIWLDAVEEEYKITPILYTSLRFYQRYLEGHFDSYPVWIAHYTSHAPEIGHDSGWTFWQHSETGKVRGIAKQVDLNVYNGTMETLRGLCKQQ